MGTNLVLPKISWMKTQIIYTALYSESGIIDLSIVNQMILKRMQNRFANQDSRTREVNLKY